MKIFGLDAVAKFLFVEKKAKNIKLILPKNF